VASRLGLSGPLTLRRNNGQTFLTDGGHYILDSSFGRIGDPDVLAEDLARIPGVVEHGLFIGLASAVIVANPNEIKWLRRDSSPS
jgi:ribose 5-phosphate isomerase A